VLFEVAEFDAGAAQGFGWGEAGASEVFGAEFDMGAELGFDVGLDLAAGEEGVQVGAELRFHGEVPLPLGLSGSRSLPGWC